MDARPCCTYRVLPMVNSVPASRPTAPTVDPAVLALLKLHRTKFQEAIPFANRTGHTVPSDTKSWSQILVTLLTGKMGLARQKGDDFADHSDVKAANCWEAIDTPRFNGVLKSGRKGQAGSIACLDPMPHLFFVLWDKEPPTNRDRCRVWVVRPCSDPVFRAMCAEWYAQRDRGDIESHNFQLHPPRNRNSNEIRNTCGNLLYPLLFEAAWEGDEYRVTTYNPVVLETGVCTPAPVTEQQEGGGRRRRTR